MSTNGYAKVPVRYENKYVGDTNHKGYLLVPYITAWYPTKLDVDPLNLPADIITPNVENRVAIREGSGLEVNFNLKRMAAVKFTVVDSKGEAIPRGSVVKTKTGITTWVGWDGLIWLDGAGAIKQITIKRADNQQECQFDLTMEQYSSVVYIEQRVCH